MTTSEPIVLSSADMKALVRRHIEEGFNHGDWNVCQTTLTDDYTARYGAEGKANVGRDHYVMVCKMLRKSFPNVAITIEDLVAEGDKVVNRYIERGTLTGRAFLGIEPAGQRYEKPGTTIYRVVDVQGLPHAQIFTVEVVVLDQPMAQGLGRVGEHVGLLSLAPELRAAPEGQARAEVDPPRPRRERLRVDQRAAHPRELALVGVGVGAREQLAHAEPEHRVAEELEALVVVQPRLVGEARVRQGLLEAGDRPRAHGLLQLREQRRPRRGQRLLLCAHPRLARSLASAESRSSCVSPPASCVVHSRRTLPQVSSTSGW